MTKKSKPASPASPSSSTQTPTDPADRVVGWTKARQKPLLIGGGAALLVAVVLYSSQAQSARREAFAESELNQARMTMNAGNVSLAAVDLGRVVTDHAGTKAGQEASILLAKVRLLEGNAELAVSELRNFLSTAPRTHYRSPAAGLLGGALEDLGRFAEAADAYVQAAEASAYSLIRAQFLLEAGRSAAAAGNRDRAAELFQRVIDENDDQAVTHEARLRLGEVRAGGNV